MNGKYSMKKMTSLMGVTVLALSMAACTTTQEPKSDAPKQDAEATTIHFDRKVEVAYACGQKGNDKVRVMYAVNTQNNQVVLAQVLFQNTLSPVLARVDADGDLNRFSSNGITWVADKATGSQVDKVDGNMLMQSEVQEVNGKKVPIEQIVTRYCQLDKAATKKIATEAAKNAANEKAPKIQ